MEVNACRFCYNHRRLESCSAEITAIEWFLFQVLEWLKHHKDDPPLPEDDENREKRTDDIPPWDQEFLKVDQGTLFEIILAANFLDIRGLLEVSCKTVANMIKGKTPEEIRKTFNIVNDFTPQEEEQIKKENSWCEDK